MYFYGKIFLLGVNFFFVTKKGCDNTASTTIKGMEAIRGLYKKTRKEGTLFGFSVCTEIKVLLGIPA
ncbi:hypothetical protein B1P91_02855 [Enterococcus faecium]|nr:hypothetical protein B1P91_02855 [Enterococcus faecium]